MQTKRFLLYIVPIIMILGLLYLWLILHNPWHISAWKNEPFHSTIEASGALAAILMCMVLIHRKQEEEDGKLFMVAMGFLGMGLLDGFHAICAPGQAFVFLHSIAGLAGGLGFVFIWSPRLGRYAFRKKWIPWAVVGGAVLIGIWALSMPGTLPEMVHNGDFTTCAISINLLAGGLFLAAALRFILDYYRSGKKEVYMFAVLALLFGLSGILFKYSIIWDDGWWMWHILRTIAYLLVLGFLVENYYQIQQKLSNYHEHLQALVDERTTELKETNEQLDLEIVESKKAEEKIIQYRDHLEGMVEERTAQLEATNKELEAFSYSVSHDLRAPLRSVDGFSQALLEDYGDKFDETGTDYLNRVRNATLNMEHIIDDLLNLSRITRGEVNYSEVDLSKLVSDIAERYKAEDPNRQVDFVIDEGVKANGDERLLQAMIENLISNAYKFSSHELITKIEFGTTNINNENTYFIRDNGVGFDMKYSDKLFGAFQRLHSKIEFPGTGIGLATVQRVIHKHGGNVWAESELGKGATFYFTL